MVIFVKDFNSVERVGIEEEEIEEVMEEEESHTITEVVGGLEVRWTKIFTVGGNNTCKDPRVVGD
jgi:hypothetical protein